jgi:hypothetical protein
MHETFPKLHGKISKTTWKYWGGQNFQVVLETIHGTVVLEILTGPIFPGSFGKVHKKFMKSFINLCIKCGKCLIAIFSATLSFYALLAYWKLVQLYSISLLIQRLYCMFAPTLL